MHLQAPGDVLGEDEGTENEYIAVYDDTNESSLYILPASLAMVCQTRLGWTTRGSNLS